ncbi:unnamed protein product [Paramecium sonneborni]|uniref:Uncharacterized protein n=1 Tax=Paramecium sonneborni TaxID=65129 RepID=A0A8S1KS98_9CILI|nr:unnamed protein product [Paramecium sonneborni]
MKCQTIYIPTKVVINQFHSMRSMDGEQKIIPQKMILDSIKQKLKVPIKFPDRKKGEKFLSCVKEKVEQQKKEHQVKLNEEDEYKRMTNITRGCQQLAQQLPFYESFNNSNLIRQQEPVRLLLNIMMERFQNLEFLNCLHKGLSELSLLQEQKTMLSCRSAGRRRKSQQKYQNLILGIQIEQRLAKNVIESLVISKQFGVTYLKPLFLLVSKLKQSLESRCGIFISFLYNTRDQQVMKLLVDIFQDCKNEIFGVCTWVNRIEDQFDQYFYQNQILRSSNSIQVDIEQHGDQSDSSESSIEIDPNEEIQKWICQDETPLVNEKLDYFRSPECVEFILKYIFDPNYFSTIHEWSYHYSDLKIKHNYKSRKLDQTQEIDQLSLIRSMKTLKLLMNENNYTLINKLVPQFIIKLFHCIYDALNDKDKNVDLNQITQLLDFLLQTNRRQSILLIIELNLMFQFVSLMYNENIETLVQKIIMDEYDMGNYVFEQFWLYLECTNWIQYFLFMSLKIKVDTFKANKNNQSDKTVNITGLLKSQVNFDRFSNNNEIDLIEKKKLTDFLGQMQPGKNYIQQFGMNQLNWHLNQDIREYLYASEIEGKDIDNFRLFISERQKYQSTVQILLRDKHFIQQGMRNDTLHIRPNSRRKIKETLQIKDFTNHQIAQTIKQLPRLTIGNQELSKWIQPSKISSQVSISQIPSKSPKLYPIRTEQSVDISSFYEGFSSGRLRGLYPSPKIQIQSSSFERKAIIYTSDISLLPSCISIMKILVQSVFQNMAHLTQTDKRQQQRFKIEQDFILPQFFNKDILTQIFRVYLYDIINNDNSISQISCECGIIINEIFLNCKQHSELHSYKKILKDCFYEIGDYICKVIVKLHDDSSSKFKRFLLITTLQEGLMLFGEKQDTPKNVFSLMNETMLHLLIVWFFDSDQSNLYQQTFVKLFSIIFSRGPSYLLGNILFKLGLISSLHNAYFNFFVNSIKFTNGVESLFYYVSILIYAIQKSINLRKIQSILNNLEPLNSWKSLRDIQIDNNSLFVQQIELIIMDNDGRTPRQLLKKKTITIQNKNIIQGRRSQITMLTSHKFSMQQTATNLVNLIKVKDKLLLNQKKSINF